MPISISLAEALSRGFDELMPREFQEFAKAIEEDPSDEDRQRIFAEWLDEQGEADLAYGLRWCAARHIRPRSDRNYSQKTYWGWIERYSSDRHRNPRSVLPDGLYIAADLDSRSFMGVIAKTVTALVAKREEMFGITTVPLPEPEAVPEEEPDRKGPLMPETQEEGLPI